MNAERPKLVIDASGLVLGRLASYAAKQALLGKQVSIVNCNDAIVTGNRKNIIAEYKESRARGGASLNGPNFPKHPERLVKRTIRGMLRFRYGRGKEAFKSLRCYSDCPEDLESLKVKLSTRPLNSTSIKLSELYRLI